MTLKEICNDVLNEMNSIEVYRELLYKEEFTKGLIQRLIEYHFQRAFQKAYPNADIVHPEDHLGLCDIYSNIYNRGIEIKTTSGWKLKYKTKNNNEKTIVRVLWENRAEKSNNDFEYFLFIKFSIIDKLLVFDSVYFGKVYWKSWKRSKKPSGYNSRIYESTVSKLCNKII